MSESSSGPGYEDEMDVDGFGKVTMPEPELKEQLKYAEDYELLKTLVPPALPSSLFRVYLFFSEDK